MSKIDIEKDYLEEECEELTKEEICDMAEEEIISKLLEDSPIPEETVLIKRLGIPLTLRALTESEISRIRKNCTKVSKVKGRKEEKLDEDEFNISLIEKATIKPNFANKKLLESKKVSSATQFIKRKFLAGELSQISDKILELSGFYDELGDTTIKN